MKPENKEKEIDTLFVVCVFIELQILFLGFIVMKHIYF